MLKIFERPRQVAHQLHTRLDAKLDVVAALPPPPIALSIQKVFAISIPMQTASVISIVLHIFPVVGVGFAMIDAKRFAPPHNIMEVVLVNSKSANRPQNADAMAQANLDGGGNTDEKRRAKTPLPAMDQSAAKNELRAAQERVKQLESEMKTLMAQAKAAAKVVQSNVAPPPGAPTAATDLMQRSIDITKLEAQLAKEYDAYQQRPKRTFIGARAAEYRFATYVDNWRQKVERVGNLNYPEEAKIKGVHGQLQLTVAIKANGEVESIVIDRSSGKKILDQAAKRIVVLAAPYDRFPNDIKRDTDILHITRTWMFMKGGTIEAK